MCRNVEEQGTEYFKGLILKKMSETIEGNTVLESLKVDEYGKPSDLLDQAACTHNSNITILLLEKNNVKIDGFKDALERIHRGNYGICDL